jgi:hypothetical protein
LFVCVNAPRVAVSAMAAAGSMCCWQDARKGVLLAGRLKRCVIWRCEQKNRNRNLHKIAPLPARHLHGLPPIPTPNPPSHPTRARHNA